MWAQTWSDLLKELTPYPNISSVDVTPQMVEQVSVLRMLRPTHAYSAALPKNQARIQDLAKISQLRNGLGAKLLTTNRTPKLPLRTFSDALDHWETYSGAKHSGFT